MGLKLTITRKLAASFAAMVLLIGTVGVVGVAQQLDAASDAARAEAVRRAEAIADGFGSERRNDETILLVDDPDELQEEVEELRNGHRLDAVVVGLDQVVIASPQIAQVGNTFPGADRAVAATLLDGVSRTLVAGSRRGAGAGGGDRSGRGVRARYAVAPLRADGGPIVGAVILDYTPLHEHGQTLARAASSVVLAGVTLAVAAAVCLGLWVDRTVSRPLRRLIDAVRAYGTGGSVLVVPAKVDGEIRDLAQALSEMAAQRKRSAEDVLEINGRLRRQAERLAMLNDFARQVAGTLDLHSVFALVVHQVAALAGAARCSVSQHEPENRCFRIVAVYPDAGPAHDVLPPGSIIPEAETVLTPAARTGTSHVVQDTETAAHPRLRALARHGIGSMMTAPITVDGRVWGTLTCGFAEPGGATAERVELLEAIAVHLGLATKNAGLYADLRDAHQRLRASQDQAIQQERLRALGQMASGIAHDFNNALAPVVGFSELLLLHPETLADVAKAKQYLGLIHTGASDAASVVQRLKEFYRHRDEADALVPVDLAELVTQVVALTQPKWKDQAMAAGKTITLETDLSAAESVPVLGDAAALREALTNLVFNAVDALGDIGTITLRLRAEQPSTRAAGAQGVRGQGEAILEVADTGAGMSEEVRRRALEPFFTTKGERGTGLGLSMVYGIVQRHGGTMDIESAPGKGTTVRLCLPLRAPDHPAADLSAPPAASAVARPYARCRALLVDDEPAVRQVVEAYLAAECFSVDAVGDGRAAWEAFRTGRYDVVVTDRAMPGMNGDQLAAAIKHHDAAVPVILLTGFGDFMSAEGEMPAGVDAVLGKPLTAAKLRSVLDRVIGATTSGQSSAGAGGNGRLADAHVRSG